MHFDHKTENSIFAKQLFSCALSNEICSKVYASILTCPKQYAWSLPRVTQKVRLANIPKLQAMKMRKLFSINSRDCSFGVCSFSKKLWQNGKVFFAAKVDVKNEHFERNHYKLKSITTRCITTDKTFY